MSTTQRVLYTAAAMILAWIVLVDVPGSTWIWVS
jgi:hypothetical protein